MTMTDTPDQQAREQALDTSRSFIVQAPAGSGKTELLTQRILKLLAICEQPEQILAITFTRKAAAEMRHRILQALSHAQVLCNTLDNKQLHEYGTQLPAHEQLTLSLSLKALEHNTEQGWDLLENPGRLQLKTIDGFCSGIVFQLPILSGLGGQSQIIEDVGALYEEASENFLEKLETNQDYSQSLENILRYLDKRSEEVKTLLSALLHRRLQWAPLVIQYRQLSHNASLQLVREHMQAAIEDIIGIHFEELYTCEGFEELKQLNELLPYAASKLEVNSKFAPLKAFTSLDQVTKEQLSLWKCINTFLFTDKNTLRVKVDKNLGFPADKTPLEQEKKKQMLAFLQRLNEYPDLQKQLLDINALPEPVLSEEELSITTDICESLSVLLAHLHLVFKEKHCLDFNEIQIKAIETLSPIDTDSDDKSALLSLDAKIKHILIDEYQDTSNSQLALLENLISQWQYQQDTKTLFLVGDPMQSIYRFREANVGIFIRAQERGIANIPLNKLTLSRNFRSTETIVNWINKHFSQCFPAQNNYLMGAIRYKACESTQKADQKHRPSEVKLFIEKLPENQADNKSLCALNICQEITGIQNKSPEETIAILVKARSHLETIIPELKQSGIPYQAIEIDTLAQSPHIIHLNNLSAALLDPADTLAWYALLRSPFLGFSNELLLKVRDFCEENNTEPGLLFNSEKSLSFDFIDNSKLNDRLLFVQQQLRLAFKQKQNNTFSNILERCWLSIGGPASMDKSQLKDCETYFQLITKIELEHDTLDRHIIENACERLFAEQVISHPNPVSLLTIHKAKGLEFDHVFIPNMHKTGKSDNKNLINWHIYEDRQNQQHLLLAPLLPSHKESSDSLLYDYLENIEKQKASNETLRLLYVAATRSKAKLYLYGALNEKTDRKTGEINLTPPSKNSFLGILWDTLEEQSITFLEHENQPIQNNKTEADYKLSHIAHHWKNIDIFQKPCDTLKAHETTEHNHLKQILEPENDAQILGSLFHYSLEQLTRYGLLHSPKSESKQLFYSYTKQWKDFLKKQAIHQQEKHSLLLEQCASLLENVLDDIDNQWIFDNSLEQSHCEQSIYFSDSNKTLKQNIQVDRSFIKEGKRWIIDYKTSRPMPRQSIDDFLKKETLAYRPQLECYAEAYAKLENRTQVLALYFPSIKCLHRLS